MFSIDSEIQPSLAYEDFKKLYAGFLLAAFHYSYNNRVEILFKQNFALFSVITASVSIALDKPYRISRSEVFYKHFKP